MSMQDLLTTDGKHAARIELEQIRLDKIEQRKKIRASMDPVDVANLDLLRDTFGARIIYLELSDGSVFGDPERWV